VFIVLVLPLPKNQSMLQIQNPHKLRDCANRYCSSFEVRQFTDSVDQFSAQCLARTYSEIGPRSERFAAFALPVATSGVLKSNVARPGCASRNEKAEDTDIRKSLLQHSFRRTEVRALR
jgi:hypothetical protein